MSLDSEHPEGDKLATPEETRDDAASFWNGNPDELPEEIQPVYKNLQADYTRKSQEVAEQRKEAEEALRFYDAVRNPETLDSVLQQIADAYGPDAVLDALGYAVDDEPEPANADDPVASLRGELDALKGQLTQQQEKAQEEALLAQIESNVEEQFSALDLSEKEQEIVLAHALTAGYVTSEGFPDVRKAFEDFSSVLTDRQKKYVEGKRAPRQPTSGAAGTEAFDFSNEDERRRLMAAMLEANSDE